VIYVLLMTAQVHRLDAATGGIVMVGKTRSAVKLLSMAFAHREVSVSNILSTPAQQALGLFVSVFLFSSLLW
jgi:hypothetical protein